MATKSLPTLTIDLLGPDGNVFFVLAKVSQVLEAAHGHVEGDKKMKAIHKWMDDGNGGGEYAQLLLHIHETYCRIEDDSGEYDFDDPLYDPVSD